MCYLLKEIYNEFKLFLYNLALPKFKFLHIKQKLNVINLQEKLKKKYIKIKKIELLN